MIEILDVTHHNIVTIKDATLPLNKIGVTVVHGLNKDAASAGSKADVNAAGKSLLLKGIPELIFASSPLTKEIKTKAKRDLFTKKDSAICVRARKNGSVYSFTKRSKGKSFEYVLEKDGEPLKTRRLKYPEDKIRAFFGMSEEEFYTLYYIDSGKPSALQFGSPAKRLEFFTNLFRLNNYDEIRKLFNGLLREAKENGAALREVMSQLETIQRDLPDTPIKELESKLEKLQRENEAIGQRFSELQAEEARLSFAVENKQNYLILIGLIKDLDLEVENASDLSHTIKWGKAKLSRYKKLEKAASAWKAYESEVERYDARRRKIADDLRKDGFSLTPSNIVACQERLERYNREHTRLIDRIAELTEREGELPEKPDIDFDRYNTGLRLLDKKLGLRPDEAIEKLSAEKSMLLTKREGLKEQLDALSSLKGCSECPTCHQAISKKITQNLVSDLSAQYDTLGQHLSKLSDNLSLVKYYSNNEAAVRNYQQSLDKRAQVREKLKQAREELKEHSSKKKNYADLEAKLNRFHSLSTMERPEKPGVDAKNYDPERVEKLTKFVSVAEILLSGFDRLHEVDFDAAKTRLKKVKHERLECVNQTTKQAERIPKITAQLELARKLTQQRTELLEKHSSLKETVDDLPILEMMIEAYSNKGIKLLLIKQIASLIERNMNQYVSLLYSEPTKFYFEVIDDRNFNILIERKIQGQKSVADVRTLSGAERRAFSFLLPLAVMPLIPSERRLNVMILDEPTVNMGANRVDLFTKSFIPKLNTIIPHIVIITPQQEHYPNAERYLVTKHKGVSTLSKL